MPSTRRTQTTDSHGYNAGVDFDDKTIIRDINTAVITRIVITHDSFLRSITVHYADAVGVTHGTPSTTCVELTLPSGEFITKVEGTASNNVISKIAFVTSTGRRWGPFGYPTSTGTFIWDGFGPGMGLLYLSGKSNDFLRTLKATFGMYDKQVEPSAAVNYEKHTTDAATQGSVPRSKFAMVLMSKNVTLLVGADKTMLNVSQEILCRLPFFRAALQGNFREASEQAINMPEDEPQDVIALVEFLYTGRYTYPYHADAESKLANPAPDLAEGLYHVAVYATAHKYGCLELVATALDLFMYVLGQMKGMDVVRLWKGAYSMNLLLQEVEGEQKALEFKRRLSGLMKELYTKHRVEMETVAAEYPVLVSDLLRLVVTL